MKGNASRLRKKRSCRVVKDHSVAGNSTMLFPGEARSSVRIPGHVNNRSHRGNSDPQKRNVMHYRKLFAWLRVSGTGYFDIPQLSGLIDYLRPRDPGYDEIRAPDIV